MSVVFQADYMAIYAMSPLVRLIEAYLTPEGDLALQGRYYQGLCLLTAILVTFVIVPGNLVLGLPWLINLAAMVFAMVAFALYIAARRGHYYTKSLFFALVATLDATWFPNAGNHGSIGLFFFPAVMYPVVFFRGLTRASLVALVCVDYVVLLWVEAHYPELVTPFADESSRVMDLASGFVGSSFTVLLPKGTLAAPDVASDLAVPNGSGLVLVVEDEAMLRQLATTALTHLGYRALTACDGVEGVDLFRTHHHELAGVLLDLKMPRKSGRETFKEMRAIDANVPVLLCSGYGDNEEAQGLISLGAIGLLPKPYRIGELAEQISRFKR